MIGARLRKLEKERMPQDEKKNFFTNTVIYFIGTALSKVLTLVVLPIITRFVTTEQYGIYDLIITVSSLFVPLFTFQIIETAYRFIYDSKETELKTIITNVAVSVVITSTVFLLIMFVVGQFWFSFENIVYVALYYIGTVILNFYQRVARSLGLNKEYAISGFISTVTLLSFQLLLVTCTSMRVDGLIYSYFASCVISSIYLELKVKVIKYIKFSLVAPSKIIDYLRFSVPLVPNSLLWWGTSAVNRLITIAFLGASANGIFSMSNKFSSIVTMVSSVIVMAWQETCIREEKNPEREVIFNDICKFFLDIILIGTAGAILIQKFYFIRFVDSSYIEVVNYVPIVMLSTVFSSFSSFWGAGYLAFKKTKDSFKTTLLGAIINITLCFVGAEFFGLYGVAFSSVMGYFIMWIVRAITMRNYFGMNVKWRSLIIPTSVLVIACCIYYLADEVICLLSSIILFGTFGLYIVKEILTNIKCKTHSHS